MLTLSFEPGGRREAIACLARQLRAAGHCVSLACLNHFGCDADRIDSTFDSAAEFRPAGAPKQNPVLALRNFCDTHDIQLIHAHDAASQWVAARLRLSRPRIKVLMTFHRSLSFESARRRDRLRNALAGQLCGAIVVGSRERRDHYLRENWIPPRKVVRIPFGVDTLRFRHDAAARTELRRELGLAEETILCGAAGHFGPEKGVDIAIRSFARLAQRRPDLPLQLVVLGTGTEAATREMQKLVDAVPPSAQGKVRLVGFRRDMPRWFSAMDLFLHTPRQEAFGLVVAEAMAARLPVVATRVGGVPDMVRPHETGLLAQSENETEIAAAIEQLCDNSDLRSEIASRAESTAQREYPVELYAQRHLTLYEDLLTGRPPRGVDELEPPDESTVPANAATFVASTEPRTASSRS